MQIEKIIDFFLKNSYLPTAHAIAMQNILKSHSLILLQFNPIIKRLNALIYIVADINDLKNEITYDLH